MKNLLNLFGLFLLLSIFYSGCDNGNGGDNGYTPAEFSLDGTWIREENYSELRINGSNWEAFSAQGEKLYGGTFTLGDGSNEYNGSLYITVIYPFEREEVSEYGYAVNSTTLVIIGDSGSYPDFEGTYTIKPVKPDVSKYDHIWRQESSPKIGFEIWYHGSNYEYYNEWNGWFELMDSGTFTDNSIGMITDNVAGTLVFTSKSKGVIGSNYTKTSNLPGGTVTIVNDSLQYWNHALNAGVWTVIK